MKFLTLMNTLLVSVAVGMCYYSPHPVNVSTVVLTSLLFVFSVIGWIKEG